RHVPDSWYQRYSHRIEYSRGPSSETERQTKTRTIGEDGMRFLAWLDEPGAPAHLREGVVKLTSPLAQFLSFVPYSPHETPTPNPYKRHRFPAEIISHCVWLYFRFCLSYRDVEELMAERGVLLTYEAVCYWCRKFGQVYANQLRRRRPRPGAKWHLDEVFLTI